MTPLERLQNAVAEYLMALRSHHTALQEADAWVRLSRARYEYDRAREGHAGRYRDALQAARR